MPLYRLLYRSEFSLKEADGPIEQQIAAIVASAAQANQRADLTGALIASNCTFIQVLEGPLAALEVTFEKICSDLRHSHVRLVEFAAAEDRVFPEWKMVRVEERSQVLDLCVRLGSEVESRLDVTKTSAIVSLMRSILLNRATAADGVSPVSLNDVN
ncbi:BLUF domain-containing protein [Agrobacterium sp.]|jgi:hypothetical protein|uniref:BLUF domain-containing protein n=1 Tax=Agrobacterium sp. TaxID=361 RepID=UPI0028ADAF86